jgi:small subunit ribosomal protein S9
MPKIEETKETIKEAAKEIKTPAKKPRVAVKKSEADIKETQPVEAVLKKFEEAAEAAEFDETGKKKPDKYYQATGRRKTAIARVRLYTKGDKIFLVNNQPFEKHFGNVEFKNIISAPLEKMNCTDRFRITVVVKGGGVYSQAEAVRHGITRALVMFNADFKKRLKKSGYLTRDPRMKERKKPGLKKARRAPQWAKR